MTEAFIGLIGVFVGSFLTIAKDSLATWRKRKQEGSYSAIRLICILREYAGHCVNVVGVDRKDLYLSDVRPPDPPQYPDDIAWRSLPEDLMHQILVLPNKARDTDSYIDWLRGDEIDMPRELWEGYAKLGYDALTLAEQLAEKYKIKATPKADLGSDWDVRAFLREKIREFENLRKEERAMSESDFWSI